MEPVRERETRRGGESDRGRNEWRRRKRGGDWEGWNNDWRDGNLDGAMDHQQSRRKPLTRAVMNAVFFLSASEFLTSFFSVKLHLPQMSVM